MNRPKPLALTLAAAVVATAFSGCQYENLNSLTLPGDKGTGDDSYEVKVELDNALNIVPNSPVRVADLNVGTIRSVDLVDNRPVVTISLADTVDLPENVTAKIGQTSLLGAKHIELVRPPSDTAEGQLHDGSVIPLERSGSYPETEDVIASAATLLNGGGLAQIKTITSELNKTLGGREGTTRQMLRRSARFATGLDEQKESIVDGLEALDRLSSKFAGNGDTIAQALEAFPPALRVLAKDRERLVRMLEAMGQFGRSMEDFVDRGATDLVDNIRNLRPAVKGLADAGKSLTDSLWLVPTVVFPMKPFGEYIRGDYINFWLTVDVGLDTLDRALLTGTPLEGLLSASENLLGRPAQGASGQAGNPLSDPLGLQGQPDPGDATPRADSEPDDAAKPKPGGDPSPTPTPTPSGNVLSELLGGLLGKGR